MLPDLWIIPKGTIERQFEEFRSTAGAIGADKLNAEAELLEAFFAGIERQFEAFRATAGPISEDNPNAEAELLEAFLAEADPDCVGAMERGKNALEAAGVELPDEAVFSYGPDGAFESCIYARRVVATDLRNAASSLTRQGLDAIAAAYPLLPHRLHPVGAGSWALDERASEPGRQIRLVASPGADPEPATRRIDFQIFPSRRDRRGGVCGRPARLAAGAVQGRPEPGWSGHLS